MEGKANFTIGNANNKDKQKITMSYHIGSFDSMEEVQTAKFVFDKAAEALGADTCQDAEIFNSKDSEESMDAAQKVAEEIEPEVEKIVEA